MVDYSKWKNIEVSDDEDDTHPNIDTPSLFRWRHQARIERMEEMEQQKKQLESAIKENEKLLNDLKEKLKISPEDKKLTDEIKKQEAERIKLMDVQKDLKKKEQLAPWNVDTLSQPKFSKTVINKKDERNYEEMTDEEKEQHMKKFVKENEALMKQFGMLRKFDDSKTFLMKHTSLVHEDTANYLVIWCINLEMEEKHELMTHVAHQCICMQYMLELSKQLKIDPRACIAPFFERIQTADVEYKRQFEDEIAAFIGRIERRAKEKIAEALKEQEEEEKRERLARLGPGGLDPAEVFETLPKDLQVCFETRDTEMLKEVISKMPEDEAKYHMKRCVDSGLWVPDASQLPSSENEEENKTTQNNDLDLD
ncbi:hypothetical protein PVAND_011458 [Polypedilum vanderplanki]|uniref:Hsp90 co-chaperone Cdc37 n=1 Tax=Polypedilum vanderplanki TaxID=319348 RepID=A0A9J6CJA1_POLVA|nr:hypothetical protein PVAND_011458 [Polypedilum vanderplanki]